MSKIIEKKTKKQRSGEREKQRKQEPNTADQTSNNQKLSAFSDFDFDWGQLVRTAAISVSGLAVTVTGIAAIEGEQQKA